MILAPDQDTYLGYRDAKGNPTAPNPDQVTAEAAFFAENTDALIMEGGQNSGKTLCQAKILVEAMMRWPGISIGIGHVDYNALEESLVEKLRRLLDRTVLLADGTRWKIMDYSRSNHEMYIRIPDEQFLHPNLGYTAHIKCIPLDPKKKLEEKLNVKGSEYGVFGWDQCEFMKFDGLSVFKAITARTRSFPCKVVMTANPEVDTWYEELFTAVRSKESRARMKIVRMNPDGNPHRGEDYLRRMKSVWNKRDRERYLEGKPTNLNVRILNYDFEKDGFDEWDRLPDDCEVWGIMDFGQVDPTVYQLWATRPNNHVYLFASLKIPGQECEVGRVAESVRELTEHWLTRNRLPHDRPIRFRGIFCDPAMACRRDVSSRKNTIQLFRDAGLTIKPSPIIGKGAGGQIKTEIELLKQLLMEGKLHICRNQKEWEYEERNWCWSSKKDEPVIWRKRSARNSTVIHHFDHMACTRYFVASYKRNIGYSEFNYADSIGKAKAEKPDDYSRPAGRANSGRLRNTDNDVGYFTKILYGD
jgi:hypothetical protein